VNRLRDLARDREEVDCRDDINRLLDIMTSTCTAFTFVVVCMASASLLVKDLPKVRRSAY